MALEDDDDLPGRFDAGSSWDVDDRNDPDARNLTPDDRVAAPCTSCRKLIYGDSPRCPYCGDYQVEKRETRKPMWFVITVVLLLIAIALYWFHFGW